MSNNTATGTEEAARRLTEAIKATSIEPDADADVLAERFLSALEAGDVHGAAAGADFGLVVKAVHRISRSPTMMARAMRASLRRTAEARDPDDGVREAVSVALRWERDQAKHEHAALAGEMLADDDADAGDARDKLAREVLQQARALWQRLGTRSASPAAWNEALADVLEGLKTPARVVADIRNGDPTTWWLWTNERQWTFEVNHLPSEEPAERLTLLGSASVPAFAYLAVALWRHVVALRIVMERESRAANHQRLRRNPSALVVPLQREVGAAMFQPPPKPSADTRTLPLLPVSAADQLDQGMLTALGTLQGHRLVRWLVTAGTQGWMLGDQGWVDLAPGIQARRSVVGVDLVVSGGVQRLAEALGDAGGKAQERYSDVLRLLGRTTLSWKHGHRFGGGSLILFDATRHAPGRAGELRVTINRPLLPGAWAKIPDEEDRVLVPILPVPAIYAPRNAAALARLDWLAMRILTEGRQEALEHGGVTMHWDRLAGQVSLSKDGLHAALELWTSDEKEPARWERMDSRGQRWMLTDKTPDYKAARDFILEGGQRSKERAGAGRRGARKRWAKKDP